MERQYTAVIEKRGRWYVAYVEEIPGVNTQGRTIKEARRNLKEALGLILEAKAKQTLTQLGSGITARNQHQETDWGKPEGNEHW